MLKNKFIRYINMLPKISYILCELLQGPDPNALMLKHTFIDMYTVHIYIIQPNHITHM